MVTTLVLLLVTPALADDSLQTTATGGQELVNAIGSLYAAQQAAEARLAAAEAELARRKPCCKAKAPAATPAPTITVEPIEPHAPKVDPELEALKAEAAVAKAAYEAAKAEYEAMKAELAKATPVVNVNVSPTPVTITPTVMQTERTRVEVRSSGFHPILTLGGALVIAGSVPEVSEVVAGRVTLGVRPTWDLSGSHAFGLTVEADRSVGGWGVRAVPTYLTYGNTGGWGLGAGAAYQCDMLTDEGCLAEHTGGLGRVSWEKGGKVAGVLLNADLEINYLTIPGDAGIEARGVLGGSVFFGSSRPNTVTTGQ